MSEKDRKNLEEQIKKEIDKKNIQEHGKDLQVQKELLDKDEWIKDKLKDLFSSKEEKDEKKQEQQAESEADKQQQKMQEQWEEIEKAVEQREQDLQKEEKIQEVLDEIEKASHEKDFEKIEELQKELEEMKKQAETTIDTSDIRERMKEKIDSMKDYIRDRERKYEKELQKNGFTKEEYELYQEYTRIEKEMEKYLDRFIKELSREIPKLKEYNLEWGYSSWRVTDMNDAGKKIRLKQWWSKLYSRYEETESMEINLWICLSIDNSWSMDDNMDDTTKLVVFLWLLCQKWGIPFHVNTFGDELNIIKDTDDDFDSRKWALMKQLDASGGCTDMWVSVKKDLEVIKKVKKTHPDTVFLPIFITDGAANEWITWQALIELIKWFKWLSMMIGIGVDEYKLKNWYPDSKVISLDSPSEIITKLLNELKKFFKQNKSKIFKVTSE